MLFGRSRESRSCEAAGRRNWPEAVPRKMCGGKGGLPTFSRIGEARSPVSSGSRAIATSR
jgi:hypothetical protein